MNISTIPVYLDKALKSQIGSWVGLGAPTIVTVITGASYLSKALKTSALPTTIICLVAEIAAIALMKPINAIDFEFFQTSDKAYLHRWGVRSTILTRVILSITPLTIGGAALKYIAPQSSIISNSAFLIVNLAAADTIAQISLAFFKPKLE